LLRIGASRFENFGLEPRLDTGMAWAEDPCGAAGERRGRGQDRVFGLPLALETDHQLFSGCRADVLRNVNGAWKAARRKIVLDANILLDKNLSIFL
jgi:Ring hydroxylating beta subunit